MWPSITKEESSEIDKLLLSIKTLPNLNNRPVVIAGNIPWVVRSNFDWIPKQDMEYYEEHGTRYDSSFDWRPYQGGLSGFYTPSGVTTAVTMLCNIQDKLLPYLWLRLVLHHLQSTYKMNIRGKNALILDSIDSRIYNLIGQRYTIDSRIKYTLPIGFVRNEYVSNFVKYFVSNPFNHVDLMKFVDEVVNCIINNTVIIKQLD